MNADTIAGGCGVEHIPHERIASESTAVPEEVQLDNVYFELRKIAVGRLRRVSPWDTLNPTLLVNEAYMKLIRACVGPGRSWTSKSVFLAAASEAMRQVVVDHYRRRRRIKRGRSFVRNHLDVNDLPDVPSEVDVLALDEAIDRFALDYPAKAELVKLRFFAGLTMPQCAQALDISLPTAERHWRFARAWLAEFLGK